MSLKLVHMHACVFVPRLLITNGMMWHVMDPYDWLNKFYNFNMVTLVSIIGLRSVSYVETKVAMYICTSHYFYFKVIAH